MTVFLTPLLAAAMSGSPAAGANLGSELAPPPAPLRFRAERYAPARAPREWKGIDLSAARGRLRAGAQLAVPGDAAAVAWSRDASGTRIASDLSGSVAVLEVRGTLAGDVDLVARIDLRSAAHGWRFVERTTFRGLDPALEPAAILPAEVRRLVVVVAPRWNASDATLARFERDGPAGAWRPVEEPAQAAVGRSGLGWVDGLQRAHPAGPALAIGDGRTPAGAFRLRSVGGSVVLRDTASIVAWPRPGSPTDYDIAVSPEVLRSLSAFAAPEERPSRTRPETELVDVAAAVVLPRAVYDRLAPLWRLPALRTR